MSTAIEFTATCESCDKPFITTIAGQSVCVQCLIKPTKKLHHLKKVLRALAEVEHGTDIYPVPGRADLDNCFTITAGYLIFWYNTADDSTHAQKTPLFKGEHHA
jgi:hypothetical protein